MRSRRLVKGNSTSSKMFAGTGPGDGTEIRVFQEEEIAMVSKMERNIGENVSHWHIEDSAFFS